MSSSIKIGGVTLTSGNTKLGRVLNVSLPPHRSCDTAMPCFGKGCYALRSCYRLYTEVRKAWDGNWKVWEEGGFVAFFNAVATAVASKKPELFRWHVGGDIPDARYLDGVMLMATRFPQTRFRAFTKRYDIVGPAWRELRRIPNLTVSLSAWPGVPMPAVLRRRFSVSWLRDPKNPDPRIPATAMKCSGKCDTCQLCWGLQPGQSVVFDKH